MSQLFLYVYSVCVGGGGGWEYMQENGSYHKISLKDGYMEQNNDFLVAFCGS